MGDFLNNAEILKNLGANSSSQWMFYDERMQKFFDYFAEHITDENYVTEYEVLEHEELMKNKEWLDDEKRQERRKELQRDQPGLFDYDQHHITQLMREIATYEKNTQGYDRLIQMRSELKNSRSARQCALEVQLNAGINAEKELLQQCQSKAKQLEELQAENNKQCQELSKCFIQTQSPPLFVHQLPLDQYTLKIESFTQYSTLFIKEHFKIQDGTELEQKGEEELVLKLEELARSMHHYTLNWLKEKSKCRATESLIQMMDLSQIHVISIADMERETQELELVNAHLENTNETILSDLELHVAQHMQQRMEQILYENTKIKLERALKKHENVQQLWQIVSDCISHAELIWIGMQLDMLKKRNFFDNTEQLNGESQAMWQRIYSMRSLQNSNNNNGVTDMFLEKFAEILGQHLGQNVRPQMKNCLVDYEKFLGMLAYAEQSMLSKKAYTNVLEKLQELNRVERQLRPLVYDSPVVRPMFENVRYLRPIFEAKREQVRIEKVIRQLREQFQENITNRMDTDRLWRNKQLLWIYFLTEPKRVLQAIEEVKKAATKVPAMTGIKVLGGIKRK